MGTIYYEEDDTLVIRLSEKPIVREVSQDWLTHVSYAEDGTIVEVVVLEAKAHGMAPTEICHAAA
jgi:predicted ATP-grasp superfamily ATP-dependent carboligase